MGRSALEWIASILVVIGALNWGLVGLASFSGVNYSWDLVALLLGSIPMLASIVYILVALSGLWMLIQLFK
ncbi:MAG: DUF378 domain-containing protein [Nanoarchaeota archaeon]